MGGWADLVCTQIKEFKPGYAVPNYSSKYGVSVPRFWYNPSENDRR